jgi:hypothetical protein
MSSFSDFTAPCDMVLTWDKGVMGWYGPRLVIITSYGYVLVPVGSRSTCAALYHDYMNGSVTGTKNTLVWQTYQAPSIRLMEQLCCVSPQVRCVWTISEGFEALKKLCTLADSGGLFTN